MFWLFVFNPLFLTCLAVMASSVPFFFPVLWSSLADTLSQGVGESGPARLSDWCKVKGKTGV